MISFNQIGDDNRIPLVQIEFDNSMAVTGTPAQRQSVLLFGQAAMKDSTVQGSGQLDTPVRITRASQARELWGRGSMIALMVAEFIAINPDTELYAIAQGAGTGQPQACVMNITGTATSDGVLSVYIGGRRYLLAVSKGQKGKELVEALVKVINADVDAPFTASAAEVSGDNAEGA